MEKKQYETPEIEVVVIEGQPILQIGSPNAAPPNYLDDGEFN